MAKQKKGFGKDSSAASNKIARIRKNLIGTEDANDIMDKIMQAIPERVTMVPTPGKTFLFSYSAVTPNLLTDRFPLVTVKYVFDWGFTGINLHLREQRNYNLTGMATELYEIQTAEVGDVMALPLKLLFQNRG